MKNKSILQVIIVVLSILLILTVGAIGYLVFKGNVSSTTSQSSSLVSSSSETINNNYVNLTDYKGSIKVSTYEKYTLYHTDLVKRTDAQTGLVLNTYDLLVQKDNSDKVVLLKSNSFELGEEEVKNIKAIEIKGVSADGKYIVIYFPEVNSVDGTSANVYSLSKSKFLKRINISKSLSEDNYKYKNFLFWENYIVHQEIEEDTTLVGNSESGVIFKVVITNLNDDTSKDIKKAFTYTNYGLKDITSDGVLTFDVLRAIYEKDYLDRKYNVSPTYLDLKIILNR